MFDKNNANIENGGWISADGKKGNGDNNKLFYIKIKPSTTYTIQKIAGNRFRAGTYQTNNIANGTSFNAFQKNDSGTSITITSTAVDTYLYVQYLAGDTNEQQILDSIQIEENSSVTEYEPYGKVWYKKNAIGKKVLNGSETTIYKGGTTLNQYFFAQVLSNYIKPGNNDTLVQHYTNYFENKTPNQLSGGSVIGSTIRTDNSIGFAFGLNSEINTAEKCKTWLSTHNLILYYVLANPTYTIITEQALTDQLEAIKYSMEGTTIITQTNEDKPFELDVEALTNISKLTVLTQAEYNALTPDSNTIYIVKG